MNDNPDGTQTGEWKSETCTECGGKGHFAVPSGKYRVRLKTPDMIDPENSEVIIRGREIEGELEFLEEE